MQWNKKCGTNVSNYGGHKKKDLVKCLIFSNLQSLFRASGGSTMSSPDISLPMLNNK